jgi:hypothetical protein
MPEKRSTSLDIQTFASFVAELSWDICSVTLEIEVPRLDVLEAMAPDTVKKSRRSDFNSG